MKFPRQLNAERIGKSEKEMRLISIWERMKVDTYLTPYIKLNSQWITDLNAGEKTLRSTSPWPRKRQKSFLYVMPKAQIMRQSWQIELHQNFYIQKISFRKQKSWHTQKIRAQYLIKDIHNVCMYVYTHIHTHILHIRFYILLLLFSC